MAKAARIFCFNLGMQRIGAAEFRSAPDGGLILQAFKQTELIADPGADATRAGQLKLAVGELHGQLGLKGNAPVYYSLPSQSVFTRFVKLPATSQSSVQQIIGFEAQQNVPFPIDEVVWDYQVIGEPTDGKIDVVLVAIKSDQLTAVNDAVEAGGFHTHTIDTSAMAVYNAFRFNYPEESGCSLLIDIGARTTNLIFVEGQKIFSRSIPMGGSTISAAVAKEFVEDFGVAEELKKQKGFVGLGGAYEDHADPKIAKMSKLIRNTMTRLHAEIARSISFYRSNQGGSQPVRIYLAGGTVSLPYMREFFSEKLQLPIEYFNPLRNVIVASTADVELISQNAHSLGELVGMALRAQGTCPLELNLRPQSVVRAQKLARQKPYLIAAAACIFLGLGGLWYYFNQATLLKENMLAQVTREASDLEAIAKQVDALKKQKANLENTAAPLLSAIADRSRWIRILDDLGKRLPPRSIWITHLGPASADQKEASPSSRGRTSRRTPAAETASNQKASPANQIFIQGLYLEDPKVVEDFFKNLAQSDLFDLDAGNSAKYVQRSQPDSESWAYTYTITLPLKASPDAATKNAPKASP